MAKTDEERIPAVYELRWEFRGRQMDLDVPAEHIADALTVADEAIQAMGIIDAEIVAICKRGTRMPF